MCSIQPHSVNLFRKRWLIRNIGAGTLTCATIAQVTSTSNMTKRMTGPELFITETFGDLTSMNPADAEAAAAGPLRRQLCPTWRNYVDNGRRQEKQRSVFVTRIRRCEVNSHSANDKILCNVCLRLNSILGPSLGLVGLAMRANNNQGLMTAMNDESTGNRFWNRSELGCFLRCSTRHVARMVDAKRIPPPIKLGRLSLWNIQVIEEWLNSGAPDCQQITKRRRQ